MMRALFGRISAALLLLLLAPANGEWCGDLPLARLDARCSANSAMPEFPCQRALDGLPHTMWAPELRDYAAGGGSNPFLVVELGAEVGLSRVDLLQYNYGGLGVATKVRSGAITFND